MRGTVSSRKQHYRALATRLLKEQAGPRLKVLLAAEQRRRAQLGQQRLTKSQLARALGYKTVSGLQAVLNGKAQPPLHVLVGLAIELHLHSIEELFGPFGTSSAIVDQLAPDEEPHNADTNAERRHSGTPDQR